MRIKQTDKQMLIIRSITIIIRRDRNIYSILADRTADRT